MTTRRLSAFLDALAAGRRPRPFHADPDDVEMLRVAIALRAARPGDAMPDETFVAELHEQLAEDLSPSEQTNVHPLKMRRARAALVAVAAGLALVGGTAAVTEMRIRQRFSNPRQRCRRDRRCAPPASSPPPARWWDKSSSITATTPGCS